MSTDLTVGARSSALTEPATDPASSATSATEAPGEVFDFDASWRLHRQVAIRPERFGALLYHFGTRRLSFVKTPTLLRVVQLLESERSARTACVAAGVPVEQTSSYRAALATLASSSMIERTPA